MTALDLEEVRTVIKRQLKEQGLPVRLRNKQVLAQVARVAVRTVPAKTRRKKV